MSRRVSLYSIAILFILIILIILNICIGSVSISIDELINAFNKQDTIAYKIIWYARLPRIIACILAGSSLAVSGAIIQNVLTNKLASPGIIGINAGAGLAVTICYAFGIYSGWQIAQASFIGALLAVFIIVYTAQKIGASRTTLILGGVAVNSCLNAISEAITTIIPETSMMAADFRVGGFSNVTLSKVSLAGIVIVLCFILLMTLRNELDILSLGEETAQGLGVDVKKMRIVFLGLAALLAGAAVSFSGLLGFVGLIIPHVVRRFIYEDNTKLLPFSALCGASFVLLCDLLARTLFNPFEIPVGILLSFVGGPFFLFLLFKRKGGHAL